MDLPNREAAYVPREKLTGYLLSETHPVGRAKAIYFRGHGLNENYVELLEEELLTLARTQEVDEEESTPHGVKYAIEGPLETPLGSVLRIRTVWIIDEKGRPRFVTAYPA